MTEQEHVHEILQLWNWGEKELAKETLVAREFFLTKKVFAYMFQKMGVSKNNNPNKLIIKAQKVLGGTIYDQYGKEYQTKNREDTKREGSAKKNNGTPSQTQSFFLAE